MDPVRANTHESISFVVSKRSGFEGFNGYCRPLEPAKDDRRKEADNGQEEPVIGSPFDLPAGLVVEGDEAVDTGNGNRNAGMGTNVGVAMIVTTESVSKDADSSGKSAQGPVAISRIAQLGTAAVGASSASTPAEVPVASGAAADAWAQAEAAVRIKGRGSLRS